MVYGAVQDAPCQGFTDSISCVAFRENTQQNAPEFLVGGSWDKTVRMYQVNPSAQTPQIQPGPTQTLHKAPVLCCTWGAANSPYADYVFSGACDNTFGMWNYKQNKTNIVNAHQSPVSCIRFVALNNGSQPALATAGWDKYLKYWDVRAPPTQPAIQVLLPNKAYCMDSHKNMLCVGLSDGTLNFYNLNSPQQPWKTTKSALTDQLRTVGLWPDLQGYCVGSIEGRVAVELFQDNPQPPRKSYKFKCHREDIVPGNKSQGQRVYPVNSISFNHRGSFATGGADGTIGLWNKNTKRKLKQLSKKGGANCITAVKFNTTATLLAYANSYDWHKGHKFYSQQNNVLYVHKVQNGEI
mgnify:CR=1 FL=1|jgi:mRNA export factor|eukprot:g4322.t1